MGLSECRLARARMRGRTAPRVYRGSRVGASRPSEHRDGPWPTAAENVQRRRPVRAPPRATEAPEQPEGEDPASEVPPVEGSSENALVHALQLGQREGPGQERVDEVRVLELGADAGDGQAHHGRMVVGQRREPRHWPPPGRRVLAGGAGIRLAARIGDESDVGHRDDPVVRITLRLAEGEELLEVNAAEGRLGRQLPSGGVLERLGIRARVRQGAPTSRRTGRRAPAPATRAAPPRAR